MLKKLKLWLFNRLKGNIYLHITPNHKSGRVETLDIELKVFDVTVFTTTRKLHKVNFIKLNI